MWNEWYGLKQYQDVPIVGGFQQLEALRGAEWRKQVYTSTETIRFSKIKRIIGAIKPEVTDRSLAVFNVVWVSVGKNLGNMVGELQKRGWIEKKSRKRKK